MAKWDDGYVTDVVYPTKFHQESTPAWLTTASVMLGYRPPDVSRPFRYADLGCAHGLTALTVAATSPHAEVWGFDFNPAHIESARTMAAQAGLTNVNFVETSFAELASLREAALPQFDFIVSHGVLSWISPANRAHLVQVINQRLRPGGLAYVSYNVAMGWTGMEPLRDLMRMLFEVSPQRSDQAIPNILGYLEKMKEAGAFFFNGHPTIDARLAELRKQDPQYLAHEFLNGDWHLLSFATVAREMSEAKCNYIGSATLSDNLDVVSVPAGMAPMVNEAHDQILRETLRDFGCAQGFRRDLYRRGALPLRTTEHSELAEALGIARSGQAVGEQITIPTALGSMTGRPEIYKPMIAMMEHGPVLVRQMRGTQVFGERPLQELLQAVALLITGGYAHALLPGGDSADARASSARLNQAIAKANMQGADVPFLVAPLVGKAIGVDLLETLLVSEILSGVPVDAEGMTAPLLGALNRSGRAVLRNGQPVGDPVEARSIMTSVLTDMLERRVPMLRGWGVLPG